MIRNEVRFVFLTIALVVADVAAGESRPNVLLILADDLGYSDLGCYGGEIETPNLDALAADGLRFTQFYNTARCWPTRAALLTGYYAQQVRRDTLPGEPQLTRGDRPDWAPLLPELLEPLGYRSYHSGKWHLDDKPLASGFLHSYRLNDFDRFFYPQNHAQDDVPLPPVDRGEEFYLTTRIADHAIECLRAHAAEHADRPFFHYLAFTSPHFPLHALEKDIDKYRRRYDHGWEQIRRERWRRLTELGIVTCDLSEVERDLGPPYHRPDALEMLGPGEVNRPLPWDELTAEQRDFQAAKIAIHAAMVDRMDQEIGRVLAQVKAMGAWDNTLVLFLSDNGASAEIMVRGDGHNRAAPPGSAESYLCLGPGWATASNTPFRRHKTWVHEGGISTPLVVHWPAMIRAAGELRHAPGHVIDIVPTLLEFAAGDRDVTPPRDDAPPRPGRSLAAALRADVPLPRDSMWWLHHSHRAIRRGDWKLVSTSLQAPWELYDLVDDREESTDLAGARPKLVKAMSEDWQQQLQSFRSALLPEESPR